MTAACVACIALGDRQLAAQDDRSEGIIASQKLERLDPLSPQEALEAFEVVPGYRIELVAAEPLVTDPIAFCFDPAGRLIVVEMRGYSERPDSLTGRVRRLTDDDGDGRMDRVETLLDGLAWPTAVACFDDGLLIAVSPDLLYLPLDDQGQPGEPEVLFTGFGKSNVQGLPNSFRWGPDLRMHGATSNSSGDISGEGLDQPLRLGRRDFAIDPVTHEFDAVAGGGQHGLTFDRWGNKFVCSNSDHLQQILMLESRPQRARRYSSVPRFRRSIAVDGPQAEVFRSSPTEAWRILRTHLRVTGQVGGPIEGGGRAAGYFTGATGVYIFEGDQWGRLPSPVAIVCDVGSNLVHRKRLEQDGLWFRGIRIDEGTEFLRSTDNWFRPVQLGSGPDGALYIADMYREVIEHPRSLPPLIKSQLDLNSGNDRGRIWRVVATDGDQRDPLQTPLDRRSTAELVDLLRHPNSWQRRTAARLLDQRRETSCIEPLRTLARSADRAATRQVALAVLARFDGGFDRALRDASLADSHPRVRQRAVQLAAKFAERLGSISQSQWKQLANDDSLHVRFQFAYEAICLLPEDEVRAQALAAVAGRNLEDSWIRWAVEGSLDDAGPAFLMRLKRNVEKAGESESESDRDQITGEWFSAVAFQTLLKGSSEAVSELTAWLEREATPASEKQALLDAIANQLAEASRKSISPVLKNWAEGTLAPELEERARRGELTWPLDESRLRTLALIAPDQALSLLEILLQPAKPLRTQKAALRTLLPNHPEASRYATEQFSTLTPTVQNEMLTALSNTRAGLNAIAEAIDAGDVPVDALPDSTVDAMRQSGDAAVRAAVAKAPSKEAMSKPAYDRYSRALAGPANVEAGKMTFDRVCAVCHRPKPGADQVGPPLKSVVEKSPEQILLSILDPNREVDPKYYQVRVVTESGTIVTGIVSAETDNAVTLVDAEGKTHQVARDNIALLQTTRQSLMPDGLSKEITPDQMRDLIGYVRTELYSGSDEE